MSVMQFVAALAWPLVVLIAVVVFIVPLWRILGELSGFVRRSHYCLGGASDDWTLDRVSVRNFCGCRRTEKVIAKIKEMQKGGYSFAPIVDEEGQVLAVFTPTCVQRIATGELKINASTDFATLLDAAGGKFADMSVGAYRFIAEGDSVKSVRQYFAGKWGDNQDFDIMFITQNGCANEPIKGIVTVWDVAMRKGS